MATKHMDDWETGICQVISNADQEEIVVRGHRLDDLVDQCSFSEMMYLMLTGRRPVPEQARVLDALLVASMEHGIAPPSMVARCFASYGTTIQAAVGGGILAFGDRMGGLGEQLAKLLVDVLADAGAVADGQQTLSESDAAGLAEGVVSTALARRERIPGYGIPLHGADPRAPKVMAIAREQGVYGSHCRLAEAIGDALATARGGRAVPMNLDGVSAAVALDLGFDWRATRLFLLTARSVSMGAHFLEEAGQDTTWRHVPAGQIRYTGPEPA